MLFNSIDFALFLPIVFLVFWWMERRSLRLGNLWLLFSSMVFYGWWDWRYLGLVFISGCLDYWASGRIDDTRSQRERKALLWLSLAGNLGILGFFKYYDFFITAFSDAFTLFGLPLEPRTLGLVLPVGISFYTFQSMSYTIDVYRGGLKPSRDPIEFGAYLLFFPQLVAGPIERASALIPQFREPRTFSPSIASDGLRQMLWGLFKKVAVADQCAPIVNSIFADHIHQDGSTLILGAVLFALQIYGDFSGYSDIAIGCARLFGFDLMRNFAFPYFSRDIAEFWRRWHISLNTWFRDYLYIPLGGSRGSDLFRIRNTFIIFIVSGFWHGANWTFLAWGALNAIFFLPLLLRSTNREHLGTVAEDRALPSAVDALRMLRTFLLVALAFIFFRANTLTDALYYIQGILTRTRLSQPVFLTMTVVWTVTVMLVGEWIKRHDRHALQLDVLPRSLRWAIYIPIALTVSSMAGEHSSFIYFQF